MYMINKMGNAVFSIHSRDKESHAYADALKLSENITLETALGVFKREVYMYALDREWATSKAIYLYNGWRRLAKAELTHPNLLTLTFREKEDCERFLSVGEKLCHMRWPIAGDGFNAKWEITPQEQGSNVVSYVKTGT